MEQSELPSIQQARSTGLQPQQAAASNSQQQEKKYLKSMALGNLTRLKGLLKESRQLQQDSNELKNMMHQGRSGNSRANSPHTNRYQTQPGPAAQRSSDDDDETYSHDIQIKQGQNQAALQQQPNDQQQNYHSLPQSQTLAKHNTTPTDTNQQQTQSYLKLREQNSSLRAKLLQKESSQHAVQLRRDKNESVVITSTQPDQSVTLAKTLREVEALRQIKSHQQQMIEGLKSEIIDLQKQLLDSARQRDSIQSQQYVAKSKESNDEQSYYRVKLEEALQLIQEQDREIDRLQEKINQLQKETASKQNSKNFCLESRAPSAAKLSADIVRISEVLSRQHAINLATNNRKGSDWSTAPLKQSQGFQTPQKHLLSERSSGLSLPEKVNYNSSSKQPLLSINSEIYSPSQFIKEKGVDKVYREHQDVQKRTPQSTSCATEKKMSTTLLASDIASTSAKQISMSFTRTSSARRSFLRLRQSVSDLRLSELIRYLKLEEGCREHLQYLDRREKSAIHLEVEGEAILSQLKSSAMVDDLLHTQAQRQQLAVIEGELARLRYEVMQFADKKQFL